MGQVTVNERTRRRNIAERVENLFRLRGYEVKNLGQLTTNDALMLRRHDAVHHVLCCFCPARYEYQTVTISQAEHDFIRHEKDKVVVYYEVDDSYGLSPAKALFRKKDMGEYGVYKQVYYEVLHD